MENYLKKKRYKILERNFSTKYGEIDLIALDGETVVFVEVKTRRSDGPGMPADAVTKRKRRRLSLVALTYLARKRWEDKKGRFDVVEVIQEGESTHLRHLPDAFDPEVY